MKKIICLVLIITGCILSASCKVPGEEQGRVVETPPPASLVKTAPGAAPDGFVFIFNGTEIVLGAPAEDVLPTLGEPREVFESPSCAFDGIDRTYYYNDFYLETFPLNDADFISVINFRTDGVGTAEGLYLGMTPEDLDMIYGEADKTEFGMKTFVKNGTELAVLVEDGEIVQITYYLILNRDTNL